MTSSIILFLLGFYVLIKGANWLVGGASSFAKKLGISNFVIGLVIIGIGTSIPEFATFFFGHLAGENEIALGTIIGSNIFNILFILGLSSFVVPLIFKPSWVKRDLLWNIIAISVPLALIILFNGLLTRWAGLLLLILFVWWVVMVIKKTNGAVSDTEEKSIRILALPISAGLILAGLIGVVLGGKWVVDGAVEIAQLLGIGERFVGLTIVAIGTSLPELTVTFVAALKRQPGIAIGNIIGSNIFDFLLILGAGALFKPIVFPSNLVIDITIALFSAVILYGFVRARESFTLKRWQGFLFVIFYIMYFVYIWITAG